MLIIDEIWDSGCSWNWYVYFDMYVYYNQKIIKLFSVSYSDSREKLFLEKLEIAEPQALVLPLKALDLMHEATMDSFSHLQIGRALLTTVIYTDGGNICLKPMNTSSSFLVHFFLHRQHPWHKHKPHIMKRAWKCLKCVVDKHFFLTRQSNFCSHLHAL